MMGSLSTNCWLGSPSTISLSLQNPDQVLRKLGVELSSKLTNDFRASASQNFARTLGVNLQSPRHLKLHSTKSRLNKFNGSSPSNDDPVPDSIEVSFTENSSKNSSVSIPSRNTVLKACTVSSGFIAALGIVIRQLSHFASTKGWPVIDCSTEVSFGFEMWHLELITGLVLLISSCRCSLTMLWPQFAMSSQAANQQVLSSLQPIDYMVVPILPGISEELLFRGALLPLFGADWKSALGVGAVFGLLHWGGARKHPFVIWATFVGFVYGYATILSSSVLVPMASHAVNNLIEGILWRSTSTSSK